MKFIVIIHVLPFTNVINFSTSRNITNPFFHSIWTKTRSYDKVYDEQFGTKHLIR